MFPRFMGIDQCFVLSSDKTLVAFLPSYHFIDNLLLLVTTTAQIDSSGFYAFMPHQISKQGYIIEFIQKILCETMTE